MTNKLLEAWEQEQEKFVKPIKNYINAVLAGYNDNITIDIRTNYITLDIVNLHIYIDLYETEKLSKRIELFYIEKLPLKRSNIEYTLNMSYYSHTVTPEDKTEIQKCICIGELAKHLGDIQKVIEYQDKKDLIKASKALQAFYLEQRHKELEEAREKRNKLVSDATNKIVVGAVFNNNSNTPFRIKKVCKKSVVGQYLTGGVARCNKDSLIEAIIEGTVYEVNENGRKIK